MGAVHGHVSVQKSFVPCVCTGYCRRTSANYLAPVLQDARVAIFASAEAQASTSEEDSSEGFNEEEESSSDDSAHDDSDSPESEKLSPEELKDRRVQRFIRRKLGPR